MDWLTQYIQPLTSWLQTHPHWALLITFLMSLTESLAIIGSIIPGSVSMTAIGILAGSGIMRIDLTLLASTLGAIAGDSLSYTIGYFYSESLPEIWPFRKYPHWLKYGQSYFERHGGKSVLIGRFFGPLRSIIPVIAGMMRMPQWRFLSANILSAIGWSILYVMPGVLIGAASHQLSTKAATRLFLVLFGVLLGIWLGFSLLKWIYKRCHGLLSTRLNRFWLTLKHHPRFSVLYHALTPAEERHSTPILLLLTLCCSLGFLLILLLGDQTQWLDFVDIPIHLFMQSIYLPILSKLAVFITSLTASYALCAVFFFCLMYLIYHRKMKGLYYLLSLISISILLAFLLSYTSNSPRPEGLLVTMTGSSFPAIHLLIATALFGFILFYFHHERRVLTYILKIVLLCILVLSGLATLYLGDYWFSDVCAAYCAGVALSLIHYLFYRKTNNADVKETQSSLSFFALITVLFVSSMVSALIHVDSLQYQHQPYHPVSYIKPSEWWDQTIPLLDTYRYDRLGLRLSLFNIQYLGNLDLLKERLIQHGFVLHEESFLTRLLSRMDTDNEVKLPLLQQLYKNKPPQISMTYQDQQTGLVYVLNIWESDYQLYGSKQIIWIGSLHQQNKPSRKQKIIADPFAVLLPALRQYQIKALHLPALYRTRYPSPPLILLIMQ